MTTDKLKFIQAGEPRLCRSVTLVTPAADTYNLIHIPARGFVTGVWGYIGTAFAGTSVEVSIGWAGNGETAQVAGFLSNAMLEPDVAGTKLAFRDTLVSFPGKYFADAPGIITATVSGTATAGTLIVFAQLYLIS